MLVNISVTCVSNCLERLVSKVTYYCVEQNVKLTHSGTEYVFTYVMLMLRFYGYTFHFVLLYLHVDDRCRLVCIWNLYIQKCIPYL